MAPASRDTFLQSLSARIHAASMNWQNKGLSVLNSSELWIDCTMLNWRTSGCVAVDAINRSTDVSAEQNRLQELKPD